MVKQRVSKVELLRSFREVSDKAVQADLFQEMRPHLEETKTMIDRGVSGPFILEQLEALRQQIDRKQILRDTKRSSKPMRHHLQ